MCKRRWIVVLVATVSGCGRLGTWKHSDHDARGSSPSLLGDGHVPTATPADAEPPRVPMAVDAGMDAHRTSTDTGLPRTGRIPTTLLRLRGNFNPSKLVARNQVDSFRSQSESFTFDITDPGGNIVYSNLHLTQKATPADKGLSTLWSYRFQVGGYLVRSGPPYDYLDGTLAFDQDGMLVEATPTTSTFPLKDGTTHTIQFDFGTPIARGGRGNDGVTSRIGPMVLNGIDVRPDPGWGFPPCEQKPGDKALGPNCLPPPCPTHTIQVLGRFDSAAPVKVWDRSTPDASANLAFSIQLETTLGGTVWGTIYLVRIGIPSLRDPAWAAWDITTAWAYHALGETSRLLPSGRYDYDEIAAGTLLFDRTGRLVAHTPDPLASFNPDFGRAPQPLNIDVGPELAVAPNQVGALTVGPGKSVINSQLLGACDSPIGP